MLNTCWTKKASRFLSEAKGYTPLHGAGFQGRAEVAALLIARGFDPLDFHQDGFVPMHRACWGSEQRHTDTVEAFLKAGMSPTLKAGDGRTPIEMTTNEGTRALLQRYISSPPKTGSSPHSSKHQAPKTDSSPKPQAKPQPTKPEFEPAKNVITSSGDVGPITATIRCAACRAVVTEAERLLKALKGSLQRHESDFFDVLDGICARKDVLLTFEHIPPTMRRACDEVLPLADALGGFEAALYSVYKQHKGSMEAVKDAMCTDKIKACTAEMAKTERAKELDKEQRNAKAKKEL